MRTTIIKRIIALTIVSTSILITVSGCGQKNNNDVSTSQSSNASSTVNKNEKVKDLAKRFTKEHGTGYGKELEDAWKQDKNNVELSAMYHYYNADFYESLGQVDNAKIEMRNINPNYSGVMSDEIVKYGIKLFVSKEAWSGSGTEGVKSKKKLTDTQRQEIKKYIEQRYDYYDKKEGKYCGDKYTDTIFKEASQKYGFTVTEIKNIWSDLDV